jgi:hypothetical protein
MGEVVQHELIPDPVASTSSGLVAGPTSSTAVAAPQVTNSSDEEMDEVRLGTTNYYHSNVNVF